MAASLWLCSGFVQNLSGGNNGRGIVGTAWNNSISDGNLIVPFVELKIYEPGTLSLLGVHVPENNMAFTSASVTVHVGGSPTALALTVPSATVGFFLNSDDSVAVDAGDTVYIRSNHGSVGDGLITMNGISVLFTPTDSDVTVTQTVAEQYSAFVGIPAGTIRYIGLHGNHGEGTTDIDERQDCIPIDCTAVNARIGINANTADGPVVCTLLHIDGETEAVTETDISITYNVAEEDFKENTNGSHAFAAHDRAVWKIDTTGASSGGITFVNVTCQFHSSRGEFFLGLGQQNRAPADTTTDLSFAGDNYPLDTQTEQQWQATQQGFLIGLCINIPVNSAASDSTLAFQNGGVDGNNIVTIPAGETGFHESTETDIWGLEDLLGLLFTIPGGGQVTYSTINIGLSFEEPEEPGVIGPYAWIECKRRIP